ncbi:MAG: HAD hydrolase-like protein [Clostridiales bacterium]|nr:HAD hydrolase-like protein [Clostridiales bacterium]
MKNYKYIFWDLDGTLINTYEGVSNCVQHALDHYGIDLRGTDYSCFIGPPLRYSFPKYAGIPEKDVEEAVSFFRERYDTIGVYECEPFPDVKETLLAFKAAGYTQALASSKLEDRCKNIIDKFGLTGILDFVVGSSRDGKIDSKIEVLNETFHILSEADPSFKKEDAVLIGDTKYDADGARQAGIDCIGVSYGFGTREDLLARGVVKIYDSLKELAEDLIGYTH